MKPLVLDTSAYSEMQRGNAKIAKILEMAQQIYLPTIVLGELKAGFASGHKQQENEKLLQTFMSDPAVSLMSIGEKTPDVFARLFFELRKSGKMIGQDDLWIAALALEHNVRLLTLDSDFSCVKGLALVDIARE